MKEAFERYLYNKKYREAYEVLEILWGETKDYEAVWDFRKKVTKAAQKGKEVTPLVRKSYFLTASEKFRDYLIAVEWDRPYSQKFFLPRATYMDKIGIVDAYQQIYDGELDVLCNSLVKRAGKSQLEINFVNFLSGNSPLKASLIEGAGDALVESFYKGILEYLTDPQYSYYEIFPEVSLVETNAKMHTLNLCEKSRFPTVMCRSIDSTQVGLSEATNAIILDDCVQGREEAMNRSLLDKKWDIINGDVLGRALEGTPLIASGTRYSLYDVIGHIQDKYKNARIKIIEVPALDENDNSNYVYFNPKLGREIFTTDYFRAERDSLPAEIWESEFQQQPFEAKGLLYPINELKRYEKLPDKDPDTIIAVCDTKEKGEDYLCMPICYVYGDDAFIEDVVFTKAPPVHSKPMCANMLIKHNVIKCTFESNLAGESFANDVNDMVKGCTIRTKRTITNKATRIEDSSDYVLKHLHFKQEYPLNSQYAEFIKSLTSYTREGRNAHDDAADAISLLVFSLKTFRPNILKVKERFW